MPNKQDQLNNINIGFILIFIIIIFFSAAFFLLLKDPLVFHDEVFFSSIAYGISNPDQVSLEPFLKRISPVEIHGYLYHGPVFSFFLSVPLKIIQFNISNLRTISVFIGAGCLIAIFFIANILLKSKLYSLLVAAIMAVEYSFLRSSRCCRPDILVFLFSCLAIYFYLKAIDRNFKAKYLLYSSLFLTLGFLTHYLLGSIALLTIFFHYLLNKKKVFQINKNDLFLFTIPFLGLIIYLSLMYLLNPFSIDKFTTASSGRISIDFHSIKMILGSDWYLKILFTIYLIVPFFLIFKLKNKQANFLFFYYIFSALFAFYGSSILYFLFIPLPAILSLFLLIKLAKKSKVIYFLLLLAFCLLAINLIEQYRLNLHYGNYSYDSLGKSLSEKIPENSKILFREVESEPIFYFIANRKDLKLASLTLTDNKKTEFEYSLSQADYLVANTNDINLVQMYKKLEKDSLGQFVEQINNKYDINMFYIEFLAKNTKEIYQLEKNNNYVLIKF